MGLEQIRSDIKEKNYVELEFPLSNEYLVNAANSFLNFLKLPQELKDSMHLKLNPEDRGSNLGYVNRKQSKKDLDDKEYFHYNADHIDKIINEEVQNNDVVMNFLGHANIIYNTGLNTLNKLLTNFEEDYEEIRSYFFQDDKPFRGFLRFLKYDIKNPGEVLAAEHYDRGVITLALAESTPGLRIGKDHNSLKRVEHLEYKAIFMPSLGFPKITDESFTPALHDVVRTEAEEVNKEISRWAIVLFADSHKLNYPSFEETHPNLEY